LGYEAAHAIQIASGAIVDLAGNSWAGIGDDTTWNFTTEDAPDLTPPTLAATDIVDDRSGASIVEDNLVLYTLSFSEDIDEATVDATDFGNVGSAPVVLGTITETSPGVFTVEVTPTAAGSLQLAVVAGATIADGAGNALDSTTAIADDTVITVDPANVPPVWVSDPVNEADATEDEAYAATLADDATDDDGDSLVFAKVSGPAWLSVASDGSLSGTPTSADLGVNSFTVSVSDGIDLPVEATLEITVAAPPVGVVFTDDFEVSSGSPDVDAAGSTGSTSKQTNTTYWVRASQGFGANDHGIVDESAGQFTDPSGEQAYAFRYTNSGLTTAEGVIGSLGAGTTYTVTFDVVGDGHNGGGSYQAELVTFAPGAARNDARAGTSGTSSLLASQGGSYSATSYQQVSFTYVADGSEAALGDDVALRFIGASTSANIDNVQVQVIPPADTTPPTLAASDIVDDRGGATVTRNDLVTYTLSFSEDIDASSVDASDFSNAGSSAVTFGAIAETSPGVFSVEVTPTEAGTLQLQVNAAAVITDAVGNALDTTTAIADDTVLTVDPLTVTVPDLAGLTQAAAESAITSASLTVGSVSNEYSATIPLGDVISQGLAAGANVFEGSPVDLVISLGLDPSPKLVRTTVSSVSNSSWTTVALGQTYNSAVIVATPIYPTAGLPPVVTRITNVTATGFDLKLDRADGLTDPVSFDVSVIAVDEGVYTQAVDGVTMEAVKYTSTVTAENNNWVADSRSYQNSYTSPVVVGQVMSANDPNWSTFWSMGSSRTQPVDSSNLNVGKHVAEDPNAVRADETIGYIVVESGSGAVNGVAYEAALGADTVRGFGNSSTPYTYPLSGGLTTASAAAVSVSGMDGNNGAWAVLSGNPAMTATSLGLHACEDQVGDSEQSHTTTQIAYIVFE
ncbi:MAG: PASTA domain-containing protein, partial [Haloferula sp.]